MIANIRDLDIHRPIWADQHVARRSFHHRIHHCFTVPLLNPLTGDKSGTVIGIGVVPVEASAEIPVSVKLKLY